MKDIKDYVCTKEQGDKLYSLLSLPKFRSEDKKIHCLFAWVEDLIPENKPLLEGWHVVSILDLHGSFICQQPIPAFTSQELGELILTTVKKLNIDEITVNTNLLMKNVLIKCNKYDLPSPPMISFPCENEAQVRAEFLIYLLE